MDSDTPQQPTNAHISIVKEKHSHKLWYLVTSLLVIGAATLGILLLLQRQNNTKLGIVYENTFEALSNEQNASKYYQEEVEKLKHSSNSSLESDDMKYFSPQCEGQNESNLILAKVTKEPVQDHEVFLTLCRNQLAETELLVRVAVLQVKGDGTKVFKYGASSLKPRCFHTGILGDNLANELSKATSMPLCS